MVCLVEKMPQNLAAQQRWIFFIFFVSSLFFPRYTRFPRIVKIGDFCQCNVSCPIKVCIKLSQYYYLGYPTISVNQTSGGSSQLPATEGDTVELTCIAISTSLPAA